MGNKVINGKSIKNSKHTTKEIMFDGIIYDCRVVKSKDGENLLIGNFELLNKLQPGEWGDKNEGFANKEAESIYDEIFYFVDNASLLLSDEGLIEELKESNPDWF